MSRKYINEVAAILLDYFENNRTFQTDKFAIIPAESFTDRDQLCNEIDRIFKRLPLMLALSCEMPRPGDFKAMEALGVPILIARDKVGTVRSFLNVCAHRWAPVVAEGLGHCARFRFTCPFHGWTYGADGKLLGISDRAKSGDINRSAHGLRELPCEERHGLVFVGLSPGTALDLDRYYGAVLEDYADFGLQDWHFLGSSVIPGPNWKLILANFFESYHIAAQHPETLAPQYACDLAHYESFGPNMRIGFAFRSIGQLREIAPAQWEREEGRHFVFMRYFFPNVTGTVLYQRGTAIFAQIFPGATPDTSRLVLLNLRKARPEDTGERERDLQARIQDANAILRDEDIATGIATQKGLRSHAHEGLLYGHNERGPQYLHEWVNWYLKGNSGLPKPVL